jgi:DNA ligase 1
MDFSLVTRYFERLEKTSSRLEMAAILAELFSRVSPEDISNLIYFCQGKIGPKYQGKEINIGVSTLISVIARYLGHTEKTVQNTFKQLGDLGLVIDQLKSKKTQQTLFLKKLSFNEVYSTFERMTLIDGKGVIDVKIKLFESILYNSDLRSAKYIVRFPISLRLGFSDSTIIDALSLLEKEENQKQAKDLILEKYNLVSDLGFIAKKFIENKIEGINGLLVEFFIPLKPALCERVKDLDGIVERLGKNDSFLVDQKIDGFRMQIHKHKDKIKIFSRNEEDITNMFPDIASSVLKIPFDFIIDSEAIAYDSKNNRYHTFQITMQRKRKYDISEKSKELPLHLKIFDIVYFKDEIVFSKTLKERRKIINENFNFPPIIMPTKSITTNNLEVLKDFFKQSLKDGFEGIIAKDLSSRYTAGSRGFNWIKYKKSYDKESLDTIDAVILGAFYGQGKRTVTGIGALLIGLYDQDTDKYYTIAKVGSGLKDEVLMELSEKLKEITILKKLDNVVSNLEPDFYVIPKIVIEVNYDDITSSSVHTAPLNDSTKTLSLRFPRYVRSRIDKKETTTLEEFSKLYKLQEE